MSSAPKPRPKYYDLNPGHLPPGALASILHRVSGLLLFFPVLPFLLYVLQSSLGSEEGYARWREFFATPFAKLALVAAAWFYAHHFWAGIRYLFLDIHWGIDRQSARTTAGIVIVLGVLTALVVAWRVW